MRPATSNTRTVDGVSEGAAMACGGRIEEEESWRPKKGTQRFKFWREKIENGQGRLEGCGVRVVVLFILGNNYRVSL